MRLATVKIEDAVGGILVHNVADADGHKALTKGHKLTPEDTQKLRALGKTEVYVAQLNADDVREDDAVRRLAQAIVGLNLEATPAVSGRINLLAKMRGILKLNAGALERFNSLEGVAVATIPAHGVVGPKKMVATIKTIGLALPERTLQEAEAVAHECGPAIWVRSLPKTRVAVILTSDPQARRRVHDTYGEPIRARVQELGGEIVSSASVDEDSGAIAQAIQRALMDNADCVILAGQTSIMDADDITPRGIKGAGGTIELYGAPVEPGNLLLLAYCGETPVVGAPGCVKSRETNVVDLILPRLLAGEHVSRADVAALANGGLLI